MSKISLKTIQKQTEEAVRKANFVLRSDVCQLLLAAHKKEKNKRTRKALDWILENAAIARKKGIAICQDTGFPLVFIEVGPDAEVTSALVRAIEQGVFQGYRKNFLRTSIVDPLQRRNPSYQGLALHFNFSAKQQGLKVTLLPKGFGSENKSALKMFNPTAALAEIEKFIVGAAEKAGPESCPPFIIGVGIGGTSDQALLLAKEALLSKITQPNADSTLNALERRLLKKINALRIGPMGLGGKCTCLAVKIRTAPTHLAGLPVGVNISCHALRSASFKIRVK